MVGIVSKEDRKAMLDKVRKKMKERSKSRKDEFEFRVPKAEKGDELNYYFRILPELSKGEKCQSGTASRNYGFYFYQHGNHWINNKKFECPRLHDEKACPICELGFDLLNETQAEDERKKISRKYLPRSYFAINVYFLDNDKNPTDLRGKVMWFSAPKTVNDILDKCINNDDPGDKEDPKAYGIFYDVMDGCVFKLNAVKKGDYNSYEASKFLPNTKGPLSKDKEGEPDERRMQEILDQRHDLAVKFGDRDQEKLKEAVKQLMSGDGEAGSGFDDDDSKTEEKVEEKTEEKAGKTKPKSDDDLEEASGKTEAKAEVKTEAKKSEAKPGKAETDEELEDLLTKIKS